MQIKTSLYSCTIKGFLKESILCLCPKASGDECLNTNPYTITGASVAAASESYYLSWFSLISRPMHINGWEMENYSPFKGSAHRILATGDNSLCKLPSEDSRQTPAACLPVSLPETEFHEPALRSQAIMALIMERAGECGAFGAPGEPVCQRRCHPGQGRPLGSPGPRDTEEDVLISGSEASSGDLRRLSSHGHGRRGGKVFLFFVVSSRH